MKALITGGAGFIGSHLCDFLLEKGFEVAVVDDLITGREENIKRHFNDPRFSFIKQDAADFVGYEGKIDYILHLASPASPADYLAYPIQTLKAGSLGTLNTLELAKEKKAKFLLASTSEVYGDPLVSPQTEDYWGNVNPVGPRSVYDETKRFAEALTMTYHRVHGLDTRIVRIFNTYGPRMKANDGRAIPNLINQALKNEPLTIYGDGGQTRSFCFISDMVEGLYKLMLSDIHEPINLGNPDEKTILELSRIVLKLMNSKSRIEHKPLPVDDPRKRKPDISKAQKLLGWQPKVGLEEGLKRTIEWYKGK